MSTDATGTQTIRVEAEACWICGALVRIKIGEFELDTSDIHSEWHSEHQGEQ